MVRGFVSGVLWGTVVAGAGLAVISQVAPLPQAIPDTPPALPEAQAPAAPQVPAPKDATKAEAPDADGSKGAAAPVAGAEAPPEAMTDPAPRTALSTAPEADAPAAQPAPPAMPPEAPDATAPDAPKAPAAPGLPPAPSDAETAPRVAPATATPPAVAAESAPPAIDLPPPPPLTPEEEALLAPQSQDPAPAAPGTAEVTDPAPPAAEPEPAAPESDRALTPVAPLPKVPAPEVTDNTLPEAAPGVTTDRLPRIGADEPLPEVEVVPEAESDIRPVAAFARPFENTEAKPLFAILLVDTGAPDLDRKALAALPFPVTFVIDPMAKGAAEAAAIYRAGMQEVVFAATGIPQDATPSDLEQTFQSHAKALPEAVAAIDLPEGGFQDDRADAAAILPILADQGRGLVTYDRGLNAADQIARREGQPAAVIFRQLDASGESIPTIRRYLDRAAFKAAQEGEVAVIGTTAPDTVAAILEWTVEGRAATVALAPVTALMSR